MHLGVGHVCAEGHGGRLSCGEDTSRMSYQLLVVAELPGSLWLCIEDWD